MDSEFLKYGDLILLQSQEFAGYMSSAGFLDSACVLQEVADLRETLNSRAMVFQLLPKLNYSSLLEYTHVKHTFYQKSGGGQVALKQEDLDLLESLQQKMESEQELNRRTVEQRSGTQVAYGQEVQFKHMASDMLLKAKRQTADGDRSCYLLELTETGSTGVQFKLIPRYKYRLEGDSVMYRDFLYLVNVKLGLYVHISDTVIEKAEELPCWTANPALCADVHPAASSFAITREVNISTQKSVFQLAPFAHGPSEPPYIRGGTVIRLHHTEIGGQMCSEGIDYTRDGLADVYVRKYKGENQMERSSAHTCFILELDNCQLPGKTCTWMTDDKPTVYRLRHLTTHRVIRMARDEDGEIVSLSKHAHEEPSAPEDSLFCFIPTAIENTNKLRNGSTAKLRANVSGHYLTTLADEWAPIEATDVSAPGDQSPVDDATFFMPLVIDDMVVARKKVVLTNTSQIEDAYQINVVDPDEAQEVEFVLSAVPLLKNMASHFEHKKEPDRAAFNAVERALGQLILFCNHSEDRNPYTCEGEPLGRRQKFLRELGVIDWVCSILYHPVANGMYRLESLRKTEPMTKLCMLGYRLVRLAAKDNRVNELYCAQWMGLFLSHAEKSTQNEHLHPEDTLTEILSDNRRLLERQLRPRLIHKFVNLLRKGRDEKYAKLITTLCTCQGNAITRNQNTICDIIASDPAFTDFMMVKVRATAKVIEAEAAELHTWVRLDSFQQFSEEHDDGKVYAYFLALLDLISELAYDRNHQTESLRTYYPFELCFACVCNGEISDTVRSKFVRILLYLHIDQGEVQPLMLPTYIQVWNELSGHEAFPCTHTQLSLHLQEAKKFVLTFLIELGGVLRANEHVRNSLVKQVLLLTQFLIVHGTYTSAEELESLCKPLSALLDGSTDIVVSYSSLASKTSDHQRKSKKRYEVNDFNMMLIECKRVICSIMSFITTIRLDYQITLFLALLREESAAPDTLPLSRRGLSESEEEQPLEAFRSITGRSQPDEFQLERAFTLLQRALDDPMLSIPACTERDLVTVLSEVMLYESSDLVHESLQLLLKLFSQTKNLVTSLLNIQLLEHEEEVLTLATTREKLAMLSLAAENAEVWLGRELSQEHSSYTSDARVKLTHTQVNSILLYFIELCNRRDKKLTDFTEEPEKEQQQSSSFVGLRPPNSRKTASADTSFVFTSPRDYDNSRPLDLANDTEDRIAGVLFGHGSRSHKDNQRLLRNLGAYLPVLEITGHKGIILGYNQERHRLVLRHCYSFLACFCHHNPTNQELLYESLEAIIEDLDKNACATLLIEEIFMNNPELCAKVPAKYIRMIIRQIDGMVLSLEKCGLFRTLAVLVKCKNTLIKANQLEVVAQLAAPDINNVLLLYTSPQDFGRLEAEIRACTALYSNGVQRQEVELPLDACYLIALLDLLSTCTEEWNAQAETISQKIVSIPLLNRLFEVSTNFWPLRNVLTLFFLNVYLDIEFSSHDNEKILWLSLERINADMEIILSNYTRGGRSYNPAYDAVTFLIGDRRANLVEFALHYVYGAIMPTLVEIFMKRGTGLHIDNRTELIKSIIALSCEFFRAAVMPRHIRSAARLLRVFANIEKFRKYLRPEYLEVREKAPEPLPRGYSTSEPESGKAGFLRRISRALLRYQPATVTMDQEFHTFVLQLKTLNQRVPVALVGESATTQEVLQAFIGFLHTYDEADAAQMRLVGIKILRKYIELSNVNAVGAAAEWGAEDWAQCKVAVQQSQNELVNLQAVPLVISVFTKSKDVALRSECLLLMIALLLGGNRLAQEAFLTKAAEYPSNKFLHALKSLLMASFEHVRTTYLSRIMMYEKRMREAGLETVLTGAGSEMVGVWGSHQDMEDDPHLEAQGIAQNALRMLQLLCEGHNLVLQRFLREQCENGAVSAKSLNIVALVGSLLGVYVKLLHKDNLQLGFQILDTLTEVTQGPCRDNQRELSQPKLIDNCRDLLTSLSTKTDKEVRGFDPEDDLSDDISELKSKTASFLLSLLEGDVDYDIVNRIVSTLDFNMIKARMLEVFRLFISEKMGDSSGELGLDMIESRLKCDSFDDKVQEGFNLFILMNKLADGSKVAAQRLETESFESADQLRAFTFFKEHVGRIEILVGKSLQRVYFPILPICKFISASSQQQLLEEINRDSPATKVTDLIQLSTRLIEEMEHNEWLARAPWHPDIEKYYFLRDVCLALAVFINLLILFFYDFTEDVSNYMDNTTRSIIQITGAVLIAVSAICMLLWLLLKASVTVKDQWRNRIDVSASRQQASADLSPETLRSLTPKQTWKILIHRGPDAPEFWVTGNRDFRFRSTTCLYYLMCLGMLLSASEMQLLMTYTAFAVLGLWYLIFNALILTDIAFRFPTLRALIQAITSNKTQLLMTSMLSLMVTFIYAMWGFYITPAMFYASGFGENGWGESMCQSLWQCFLTVLDLGPRLSGGIGDVLLKFTFEDKAKWYGRFFMDLSYFLVFRITLLNIILGTIIDAFAQMREKNKFRDADKRNKCLICSIERQVLDRANGFERHLEEDHNIWHYIYFLVHLKNKDPTEWNGSESHCASLLQKNDISWVPLHRAMSLGAANRTKDSIVDVAEAKIKAVSEQMQAIQKALQVDQ